MSIDVYHDSTKAELEVSTVSIGSPQDTEVTVSTDHCVTPVNPDTTVEVLKKEYSIVGDGFYASISGEEAPAWLLTLIDNVVANVIGGNLLDYDLLVQDIRNAIDALDVAKNTYDEQIAIHIDTINGVIATHLATLNASFEGVEATLAELDIAVANNESALVQAIEDLNASFSADIDARATQITTAYSSADQALANNIDVLTAVYTDPDTGVVATANAVDVLQSYVGITGEGDPNNLGLLADISVLKKQLDGSVDIYAGAHDIRVTDEDIVVDGDTNELYTDQWPYALWTPMSGVEDPSGDTRTAYKDTEVNSYPVEPNTVYHNTTEDTYFIFTTSTSSWEPIDANQYNTYLTAVRDIHKGDSYIKYTVDTEGIREYVESFKFVQIEVDDTSPYATDAEGYTWLKIVDNDAQAAYIQALNAYAFADNLATIYFAIAADSPEDADGFAYYFDNGYLKDADTAMTVDANVGDQATVKYVETDSEGIVLSEDIHLFYYNGLSWVDSTTNGLVASSKWAIDLDAYLGGNDGNGSWGGNTLLTNTIETTSQGEIQAAFQYDAELVAKDGGYYRTGFGLLTEADPDPGSVDPYGSQTNPFTSEFWVQADKFKVIPAGGTPNLSEDPIFTVDGTTGKVIIGADRTEATKNTYVGVYDDQVTYDYGDIVSLNGVTYLSKFSENTEPLSNVSYWGVLGDSSRGSVTVQLPGVFASPPTRDDINAAFEYETQLIATQGDTVLYTIAEGDGEVAAGSYTAYYTGVGLGWSTDVKLIVNGDAVIDGTLSLNKLVASGSLSSANFITGENGWAILDDGRAEFNQITVRASSISGGLSHTDMFNIPGLSVSEYNVEPYQVIPDGSATGTPLRDYAVTLPFTDISVTNNYDLPTSVTGIFTFNFGTSATPAQGTGGHSSTVDVQALIEYTFDPAPDFNIETPGGGWVQFGYAHTMVTYNGDATIVGLVPELPVGATATFRVRFGGFWRPSKPKYFYWGTGALIQSTLLSAYEPPAPVELYESTESPTTTVYRYMSSETENGTYTEADTSESVWLRRDTWDDDTETWIEGTPINLEGTQGVGAYTVNQTNENVSLSADEDGVVSSYSGTSNLLTVVQDGTLLTYANVGTLTTPGTWKVTALSTNLCDYSNSDDSSYLTTIASVSDGTTEANFGALTSVFADNASVSYTVQVYPIGASSTAQIVVLQTISKTRAGSTGPTGPTGPVGPAGDRGTAVLNYSVDLGSTTPASVTSANVATYWSIVASNELDDEVQGDQLILTNTNSTAGWTNIFTYNGSVWANNTQLVVNGDAIVNNTLSANKIVTGSITTSLLDFTPVESTNVIASINASEEGIIVAGDKITLNGYTTVNDTFTITASDNISDVTSGADVTKTVIDGGLVTTGSIILTSTSGGSIKTSNFVDGTSGWSIDADGNAEFNDITVRGSLAESSIDGELSVATGSITAGTTTINSTGIAGTGFSLTSTGLDLTSGSIDINNGVFSVDTSGNLTATSATITGDITANSGSLSNLDITGELTINSSGSLVAEGSTGNNVVLDSSGITGISSILGTTFNLPSDGSAPTFSSGIIEEVTYKMYTSGVIKTADDPITEGGVIINNTGIKVYDDSASHVLTVDIGNNGNFTFGDSTANNYIDWDGVNLTVRGSLNADDITTGSIDADVINVTNLTVGDLSDAGNLATKDQISSTDLDTTIISGGKIVTGLLTADNITTGTLNANNVTVTNLDADNITTGVLTGRTVQTSTGSNNVRLNSTNNQLEVYYNNSLLGSFGYNTYGTEDAILYLKGTAEAYPIYIDATDSNATMGGLYLKSSYRGIISRTLNDGYTSTGTSAGEFTNYRTSSSSFGIVCNAGESGTYATNHTCVAGQFTSYDLGLDILAGNVGLKIHTNDSTYGGGATYTNQYGIDISTEGVGINIAAASHGLLSLGGGDSGEWGVIGTDDDSSTFSSYVSSTAGGGVLGYSDTSGHVAVAANQESTTGYAFYATGNNTAANYAPFTGSHEGLIDKEISLVSGDIIVDKRVINKLGISCTVAEHGGSYESKQKNIIGVMCFIVPLDFCSGIINIDGYKDKYNKIVFNALGEGQINVVAEGGDIEAGDYICSSSTPGKGMKQDDDLLHNYTVAKAREDVTWAQEEIDNNIVKMVACTYHCG